MAHSSANSLLQREMLDTIKGLRSTIENLQTTIEDLRKALSESQERERVAKEQIEVMTKRLFGQSSEKIRRQQKRNPLPMIRRIPRKQRKRSGKDVLCVQRYSRDSGLWKSPLLNCLRTSRFVITAAQG